MNKSKYEIETVLVYSYNVAYKTISISICEKDDCVAKEKVLTSLNNLIESSPPQDKIRFDSCDLET